MFAVTRYTCCDKFELLNLTYSKYIFWCYLIKYKMELDQVHFKMFPGTSSTSPSLYQIFAQDTITLSNASPSLYHIFAQDIITLSNTINIKARYNQSQFKLNLYLSEIATRYVNCYFVLESIRYWN